MAEPRDIYLLGISCNIHESSAVLVKNGELIAAVEEERFSRKKHDRRFPELAIGYCLREAGISMREVSHAGFYWQPWKGLLKRLWWLVRYFPASLQMFERGKNLAWLGRHVVTAPRGSAQTVAPRIPWPVLLRRASPGPCRQRIPRIAVRLGGDSDRRPVWRGLHDAHRPRARPSLPADQAILLAPFARYPVRSTHAFSRVRGQR